MNRRFTATTIAAVSIAAVVGYNLPNSADKSVLEPSVTSIVEEDANWDCRTMGNHSCDEATRAGLDSCDEIYRLDRRSRVACWDGVYLGTANEFNKEG